MGATLTCPRQTSEKQLAGTQQPEMFDDPPLAPPPPMPLCKAPSDPHVEFANNHAVGCARMRCLKAAYDISGAAA